EIQVFADAQGNVLHLFERDCSVQRRHQKIIEEAPSPAVGPDLRARMGAAAVDAARAVGYVGAGTVEMLLDDDGSFYFMEMNTRLQVEHPVTEMVTGLDLVALQLAVAAGEPLPFAQDDLRIDGHAIEARLYAEDARAGFLPQTGRVRRLHFPDLAGVRIDHGLLPGAQVTADYDPMLAKVIAHGASRDEARAKLCRALEETVLHGVITNRGFLCDVLEHPVFAEGEARTRFVDETTWPPPEADQAQLAEAVGAASWAREGGPGWRSRGVAAESHLELDADGARRSVAVRQERSGAVEVEVEGSVRRFEAFGFDAGGEARFVHGGLTSRATVDVGVDRIELSLGRGHHTLSRRDPSAPPEGAGGAAAGAIRAPMAGKIVDVRASDGAIEEGRVVLVLEAMKMQLELEAPRGGHLLLHVQLGDQVASKQVLAEVAEAPGE
ncbi:MAG: biotin/lipoyl-containing protein, partial [Myxococcota bacterium]